MPRPRAIGASLSGPGEGRACHFIKVAVRLMTSAPRASLRPRNRNSTGSTRAATANSSIKLSTAKQLAGLPGERSGAGRNGASLSQCTSILTLSAAYGRIAILRDLASIETTHLVEPGSLGPEQGNVG